MKKTIAFLLSTAMLSALCACAQPPAQAKAASQTISAVSNVTMLSDEAEVLSLPTRRSFSSFTRLSLRIDALSALKINGSKEHYKGSQFGFKGIGDSGGLLPPVGRLPGVNPPEEGIPTPPTVPVESAES